MKLLANLVLCALAFTAVTDAASIRRVGACDGGDPEPTPAPTTTVPATTVPATTAPATSTPAPETTAPVTTTPAPETTAPVTTTPAPETTAPVTTTPAPETTAPVTTTPAPETTAPVTTTPAPETTAPVTTTPAPETTAPVTTTPAPETTAPVTTTPAPETTAPATTPPATSAPAPSWDLTTPYDKSGPTGNCDGFLRLGGKELDETNCVPNSKFSFFDGGVLPACIVCVGTYDASLSMAPFPLCNNKPVCGRIGDYTYLTQGEVSCLIKANGDEKALAACDLGNNAVIPTPAPQPSTPAPETSAPTPTTPAPTFPVPSPAPVPTTPISYDMDTPYERTGVDCEGIGLVKTTIPPLFDCIQKDTYFPLFNRGEVVEACLGCPGTYDASTSPPLCNGKPICGRIGEYIGLTQTQLQCIANSNGSENVVAECALTGENLE